ncbi:tRNA1(Val) (adenine(37)-N6)-methyltransferase [Bacteroides sp.]
MPNPYFQFKQFTVWHDKCAMKVGTDGVLLGAWPRVEHAQRILDVGTGTGLVALMLAQRSKAFIVALEIDSAAAGQATENIARSPWQDRIEVVQADFKHYTSTTQFDAIVSNPPYFEDSLKCPDHQRNTARHANELSYEELLKGVARLLSADGEFTIVIPTDVSVKIKEIAAGYSLHPYKQLNVITKPGLNPKRTLITFTFQSHKYQEEDLVIELARHEYSKEYIELTKEYYLKM